MQLHEKLDEKKINLEKQCKKVGLSRMEWDYLSRVSTCKTKQLLLLLVKLV